MASITKIDVYQPHFQLKPRHHDWFITKEIIMDHCRLPNGILGVCCATHNHLKKQKSKEKCGVQRTNGTLCSVATCRKPLEKIVDADQILFHNDVQNLMFESNQPHIHNPPCGVCVMCLFGEECVIKEPVVCYLTNEYSTNGQSTVLLDKYFLEHSMVINPENWFICKCHKHRHRDGSLCYLMMARCCDFAVPFYSYHESFAIQFLGEYYNCFHPISWEVQIKNYFVSLLKYLLSDSEIFISTYKYLIDSSYKFGKIKSYLSGKASIIRVGILGLFVKGGLYQTGTMDSSLKFNKIKIPKILLDMVKDDYFVDMALVNRDPSIKTTCMYAVDVIPHDGDTIIIPDALAKPMNQDNDGDRNSIYLFSRTNTHLVTHQLARLELKRAKETIITNLGLPRISFSEYIRIKLYRALKSGNNEISNHPFLIKRAGYTFDELIETGCMYDRDLFLDFYNLVYKSVADEEPYAVSIMDLNQESLLISSIYKSKAKGSAAHIKLLLESMKTSKKFEDAGEKMFEQMKKYVASSQTMSVKGRMQFIMLAFLHDVVLTNGLYFLGTKLLADLKPAETSMAAVFNFGSLRSVTDDLIENLKKNKN